MLIKILKGEELFSREGTHICDNNGIAIVATEDTEFEVEERIDIVKNILKQKRLDRGLDEDGNPIPEQEKESAQEINAPQKDSIEE